MTRLHTITIGEVVAEHRRSRGDRPAMVCGAERWTWAELDERVNRLANRLHALGVEPGARVVWLGQNCHRGIELFLAAARLGAMFCATSVRDSAHEVAFMLDDLDPRVVVWQGEGQPGELAVAARSRSSSTATWVQHDDLGPDGYEAALAAASPVEPDVEVDPESSVIAFYTAAYDGRPCAAMLSHRAILAQDLVFAMATGYGPETVYLNAGPYGYLGVWQGTFPTIHFGGTNVVLARVDPQEMCEVIDRERVTKAFLTGGTMQRMAEVNADGRLDLSSLRTETHSPAWDAMVTVDPTVNPMGRGLGLTEVMGMGAAQCFGGDPQGGRAGTGWPTPTTLVRVVDEKDVELPDGEVGILAVRGPTVMNGYWNRPEANEHVLSGGWFHFHHAFVRRKLDGSLAYAGIRERVVRSGGENVYPPEIERVVLLLDGVAECAVLGVPDPRWGQAIKAVVVVAPGAEVSADAVIEHCRTYLASFRKPRYVELVDELPRRADGEIDRDGLDERYGGAGYPGTAVDLEP